MLTEEVPGVQLLSTSSSCAYSILEGIKEIESEQIRQMNARLVERQDELSHLSVLLDQYQRMAEACKKDILATKQELEASEPVLAQKDADATAVLPNEPEPPVEEPAKQEVVETPALPVGKHTRKLPSGKKLIRLRLFR